MYNIVPENGVLGFDGRVVSMNLGKELEALLAKKGATLKYVPLTEDGRITVENFKKYNIIAEGSDK